jgi:hypothetical protein
MESTAERQTFTVAVLETEVSDEALDECASVVVKVSLQSTSGTELASAHLATVEGTGGLVMNSVTVHASFVKRCELHRCSSHKVARQPS